MSRGKYKFNPESLSYERIEMTWKKRILNLLTHFSTGLVLAVIMFLLFTFFFDSPEEKQLKRELNKLIGQYQMLNKRFEQAEKVLGDMQERDDNIYRVIFEADPIPSEIRTAGFGGVNHYKELEGYENSDIVIQTARRLDMILKKMYVQSKSYDEVVNLAKSKEEMLSSIPAIQPIAIKDLRWVASYFGYRIHPIYKIKKMHEGMDFSAPIGTPIFATGNGTIQETQESSRGYGRMVIINHGYGYTTRYAHLSKIGVNIGQKVKRGDVIGYVGNSGLSVAPHLHYEVRRNGIPVNPINYYFNDLSPAEFDKLVEMSKQGGQSLD